MVVDKVSKELLQKLSALPGWDVKELSWSKWRAQKMSMVIARQPNTSAYIVGLAHVQNTGAIFCQWLQ